MKWSIWFVGLCLVAGFIIGGPVHLCRWRTYIVVLAPVGLALMLGIPLRIAKEREEGRALAAWAKGYTSQKSLRLFWDKVEQFPFEEKIGE